jgi:hypothetical protein
MLRRSNIRRRHIPSHQNSMTMKFTSIFKYFQMNVDPVEVREVVNGVPTVTKKTKLPIEFINGKFETTDEEQIAALRKHPGFGSEILEMTETEKPLPEPGAPTIEEVEAKTMNQIIAFLVDSKKADPSEFAGLKKDELIAYALEHFNVKFI